MIIDSDEDDTAAAGDDGTTFVDNPIFEDAAGDDSLYPDIAQTLDLSLGTSVFHIATLPMMPCAAEEAIWDGANILKERIVFAVSCASREVYLVTLPLTPPSTSKAREELRGNILAEKAGNGKWGETLTLLAGQERYSNALAMMLVKQIPSSDRSKSSERSRSAGRVAPRVVVAAHSREASGTLRLWDVPLQKPVTDRPVEPFQTEYLPSPLDYISFNPTHTTQLLCNASPHAVRIYDYAISSMPNDDLSDGPFPSQGSWLVSLYPPFVRPSASRKPVVAAAWIAHGKAVLALLADGQWGIWDVDGVSPLGPQLLGKHSSGIRGAAITSFSAAGFVEGTGPLRNPGSQRSSAVSNEFVPMTPHSRREALNTSSGPERLAAVRGGIVVTPLPTRATTTADESVVLWIGSAEHIVVIPGISKFWEAQLRKGTGGGVNLFSGAQPTRMIRLSDLTVGLMGERCVGVGAIAKFAKDENSTNDGLPIEVIICGESRLDIVRESDTAVGARIGGVMGRRKRLSDRARENSAIIVYPKPAEPPSQAFNLSIHPRRKLSDARATTDSQKAAETVLPSTETEETPTQHLPSAARSGFSFADSLNAAADVTQDDEQDSRDVEVEMLDLMEIDRELDAMNNGRGRGRKRVAFDS
jgi:hypothetical protein